MITYMDWAEAGGISNSGFILKCITEYKNSPMYKNAAEAQLYYMRENPAIMNRLTYLQKHGIRQSKVKFHKICSGFFPKFVKQLSQYLLGNGVTIDDAVKEKLGVKFDNALQKAGMQCLVDGVNWGYWRAGETTTNNALGQTRGKPGELIVFRATEFVPILDEINGDLRVGIRFTQIAPDKPMRIEVFEEDGITVFATIKDTSGLMLIKDKTPYVLKIKVDATGETVVDPENDPMIPVYPLYANELKHSEFTPGIKSMIDAYDFINSDLADTITQVEGLYWTIKNYGGDDAAQLLTELQELKSTYTDGENSGVESHVIEVPYQAKQTALNILQKQLYADFMALNLEEIRGGSLTNVAINVATTDFSLKADIFEWQVVDFVQNILSLIGINDVEPKFKRRTVSNDSETVENISTMLSDGYIDTEWAVINNPLIADDEQEELLERLEIAAQEEAEEEFPMEEESLISDEDMNFDEGDSEIEALLKEIEELGADL